MRDAVEAPKPNGGMVKYFTAAQGYELEFEPGAQIVTVSYEGRTDAVPMANVTSMTLSQRPKPATKAAKTNEPSA